MVDAQSLRKKTPEKPTQNQTIMRSNVGIQAQLITPTAESLAEYAAPDQKPHTISAPKSSAQRVLMPAVGTDAENT
jgi:hypothetical protein